MLHACVPIAPLPNMPLLSHAIARSPWHAPWHALGHAHAPRPSCWPSDTKLIQTAKDTLINTTYTTYTTYTTPASSLWETAFLCISRISLDIMWHQYMCHSQATGESGVSGVGGVTGVYVIFVCQYMSLTGRWGKWRKWCRWCNWCGKWRKWSNWCVCEVKFSGCH